jgi:cytoskeletal protein CcmA (bactofilin family)
MARRDDVLGVSGAETIIGAGVVAEGNLDSEGDIHIEGTYTGRIKAHGDVALGINAKVKGDIDARNISVAGALKGNIVVEGEASVRETGHVNGDITCISLGVEHGGVFVGRSKMQAPPVLNKKIDRSDDEVEKPTVTKITAEEASE